MLADPVGVTTREVPAPGLLSRSPRARCVPAPLVRFRGSVRRVAAGQHHADWSGLMLESRPEVVLLDLEVEMCLKIEPEQVGRSENRDRRSAVSAVTRRLP